MNIYEQKHNKTIKDIQNGKRISPLTAIRLKCLECNGFQSAEVASCKSDECILWAFKYGKNGSGKRSGANKGLKIQNNIRQSASQSGLGGKISKKST